MLQHQMLKHKPPAVLKVAVVQTAVALRAAAQVLAAVPAVPKVLTAR